MAGRTGASPKNVFIGPAGWSYPDWKGIVYPARAPAKFDALAYIAKFFRAVEVNSSFYRPPTPRTTAGWVRRVAGVEPFQFAFKLHQAFTHERADYDRGQVGEFEAGLTPVAEAGRLGCLLVQFPWSFRFSPEAVGWLRRLRDDFGRHPLVVEVRHRSWDVEAARDALRELGLGLCNIDQPALPDCLGPAAHATSAIGYVRLHGRRSDTWFADNVPAHERYNYLYTPSQLEEWRPRIARVAENAEKVFVFTNNHYLGQGPANALQLRAMIEGGRVDVPEAMLGHFPELSRIYGSGGGRFRETLFDA